MPESVIEKAESLWREMNGSFSEWPGGVVGVPRRIELTAFFPGGLGLWRENNDSPLTPQYLVVGHDFGPFDSYEEAFRRRTEIGLSVTWRGIQAEFPRLGLEPSTCFFTNFYMGLRRMKPPTGTFPGSRDPEFVHRCARFLTRQIEVIQPKLVITLGLPAIQAVARHILREPAPPKLASCVSPYLDGPVPVVALTHPAYYPVNVGRRRYGSLTGREAERAMLQTAFARIARSASV